MVIIYAIRRPKRISGIHQTFADYHAILTNRSFFERIDFTVEEVKYSASTGTEKTGIPDLFRKPLELAARPFLAS